MVLVVVGGQWGDEGKGKIVSYLCLKDKVEFAARAGVGPNAGHTVEYEGRKMGLRLVPSGVVSKDTRLLIGAGVLVDPEVLLGEIEELGISSRIGVDRRCGVIEKEHVKRDRGSAHLKERIGSTGTGCGPANMDRVERSLKLALDVKELKPYLTDVPKELNTAIKEGRKVVVECSQGFGLSLLYGTYPYVTSKDTTAAQACVDVGIGPRDVKEVVLVLKSYPSRVGEGPFPTELPQGEAEKLGIVEYGTVTGRRRRAGVFDFEMAEQAAMINSASQLAITCLDYVDRDVKGVRSFDKLSAKAKRFVEEVERRLDVPVTLISTGPDVWDTIDLREERI